MATEKYTYRAVTESGHEIEGRIVESNFSDKSERGANPASLHEMADIARAAATQTGKPTRVLRDDGTVAATFRP